MKETKCVIYARVSESRTSADSMSCEAQIEKCKSYADANDLVVVEIFADQSISGKNTENRPGLKAALDLACKEKAVLLCYSLSRVARSMKDCIAVTDRLRFEKADFACVKEKFDTTSPAGKFIFHIFAALGEFEREQISQRTSDSMLSYIANGKKMSSRANFGFRFEGNDMVRDEDEQRIIRRIGELRKLGLGYKMLRKQLAFEGWKPRKGAFSQSTVIKVCKMNNF